MCSNVTKYSTVYRNVTNEQQLNILLGISYRRVFCRVIAPCAINARLCRNQLIIISNMQNNEPVSSHCSFRYIDMRMKIDKFKN